MVKKTVSSVYDKGLKVVQADGTTKINPFTLDATSSNADFTIGPVPQELAPQGCDDDGEDYTSLGDFLRYHVKMTAPVWTWNFNFE